MIDEVLTFLKDNLNANLGSASGQPSDASSPELVSFIEGDKVGDSVGFPAGAVSAVLVNLEEEQTLRPGDRYVQVSTDGTNYRVQPEIRLNLFVLFVAQFKQYAESLKQLSRVIHYFQNHRVFNHKNTVGLSDDIDQIILELMTLSFGEQNELWGMLRTNFRPSVLYKIKMIVFRDEDMILDRKINDVDLRLES